MRSAPPLTFSVTRFGVWRAIVALLAGSACAAMFLWWRGQPMPTTPLMDVAAAFGSLVAAAIALTLWRMPPLTLRWDRQRWWVACGEAAERPGDLAVAIDLGPWLLLRFVAEAEPAPAWRRGMPTTWIALQRRGLVAPWHAIRCALYTARPVLPPDGAEPPAARLSA